MKSSNLKLMLLIMILTGALVNSCQKDQLNEELAPLAVELKSSHLPDLPLYMSQDILIGEAMIVHDPLTGKIIVTAEIDNCPDVWEVSVAHLYAGEEEPESSAPGLFPYKCYGPDIMFEIDGPDFMCGEDYGMYFALHIELKKEVEGEWMEETAWVLHEEGESWENNNPKKDKTVGWGEFFEWKFYHQMEITDYDLTVSTDMDIWMPVADNTICRDTKIDFYYFDVDLTTNIPLEVDVMNPFYLDKADASGFMEYWDAKGVHENASGWQGIMWDILQGSLPMFYLVWDGEAYSLVDGLLYNLYQDEKHTLSISGDYPAGTYCFKGDIQGVGNSCMVEDFKVSLIVDNCEFEVGDLYGGGVIVYLFKPGDFKYDEYTGIIGALDNLGPAKWGCKGYSLTGEWYNPIGYGDVNTKTILNECNEEGIAAELCIGYKKDGYEDWYLPSFDELKLLNEVEDVIDAHYWSSSQANADTAESVNLVDNQWGKYPKDTILWVKPIRYF